MTIKTLNKKGCSQRGIAHALRISRNTVKRRLLDEAEAALSGLS